MAITKTVSSSSSKGLGFTSALTILFIALKLLGKIDWSWWWVLAPTWISAAVVIVILLIVLIFAGLVALIDRK